MKKITLVISIFLLLLLAAWIMTGRQHETFTLSLKDAGQKGSFELVDNTPLGVMAVQRAEIESVLTWKDIRKIKPGWYRISFPATSNFQVIPGRLDELEPFIISVTNAGGKAEGQVSFTYKDQQAKKIAVKELPEPLLQPTQVQTWRSSRAFRIGEHSSIDLAVRRPLLVVGDMVLEKVPEKEATRLSVNAEAPYSMFTDNDPVVFHYGILNPAAKAFQGELRFIVKDVLDGSEEEIKRIPVNVMPGDSLSGDLIFKPAFGAYRLSIETMNSSDNVLYREFRHFTYSPAIDPKSLPESWPVAFHRHSSEPEMIPPIGVKWVRLWGGWGEMEPEPGRYNWTLMDVNVRMAQKYGYRLLWVCHGIPSWALSPEDRNKPRAGAHYAPENIDRIRPFLREFWKRYAASGVIGAVEIGNEPNAHPGWTPEKYGKMALAIYQETHKATKGVRVVGISMSGGTHIEYMEKALTEGLDKNMDIASLHLYEISNPVGDRSIERKTRLFFDKLKEHGLEGIPVWNTESGSSTDIRQDGRMLSQEELNLQVKQNPEFDINMAWRVGKDWRGASELLGTSWMIRACFQEFAMGVEKDFIFQWSASPHYSWVHDWRPGGNPMPKIKVVAAGVMSKMLLDYGPTPDTNQPEVNASGDWLAFAHRFHGPEGKMTIVYVQPNLYAGSGDPVAALAAGDDDLKAEGKSSLSPWLRTTKPEPVSVRVPVTSPGVILMDMFGKTKKEMAAKNGFVEIEATEVPQYVIELSDDVMKE